MTPTPDYDAAIAFFHSVYLDKLKTDPETARRFIERVQIMTPEQIVKSYELVFEDPHNTYRRDAEALLREFPDVETIEEMIAVKNYSERTNEK